MKNGRLFMESTTIEATKTAGEIISLLVQAGARQIGSEYNEKLQISGIKFTLEVMPGQIQCFVLPSRVDPVFQIFRKKHPGYLTDSAKSILTAKAERVAWRQLYRWAQAQLAMIQCGMVEAQEVFLPYMQHESGQTLYELMKGRGMKLLAEKTP